MKNVVAFLVLAICVFSCKKESPSNQLNSSPKTQDSTLIVKDSILHTQLDSTAIVKSIRDTSRFNSPEYNCGSYIEFIPRDSSASLKIDLNKDNMMDYNFTAKHYVVQYPQCGIHCTHERYGFAVTLEGINTGNYIRGGAQVYYYTSLVTDTLTDISSYGTWYQSGKLAYEVQDCLTAFLIMQEMYIGIKIGNNYGWIHVKPINYNGVQIIDYAINLTPGNPIKAGQKK